MKVKTEFKAFFEHMASLEHKASLEYKTAELGGI